MIFSLWPNRVNDAECLEVNGHAQDWHCLGITRTCIPCSWNIQVPPLSHMEFTIFLIVAPLKCHRVGILPFRWAFLPHSHKGGTSSIVISIGHNVPGKQTAWEKTVDKVKLGWSSTPNSSVPFTLFQQDSSTGMNLFRIVFYQTHSNQVKKPIERLSVISMHKGLKASCPRSFRCFFLSYFYHINLLTSNSQTWPFLHRPEELERQAQHQPEAQTSLPFLEDAPWHPCMLYSTWIQQCSWQLPSMNGYHAIACQTPSSSPSKILSSYTARGTGKIPPAEFTKIWKPGMGDQVMCGKGSFLPSQAKMKEKDVGGKKSLRKSCPMLQKI